MKFLSVFALLYPLLSGSVANAERKLPTDLQVDLIFPRNETYAPTQLLPIVFGLSNLDAAWPLKMVLNVKVRNLGLPSSIDRPPWIEQTVSLYESDIQAALEQTPGKQIFHFPVINMTHLSNGTLGSFVVLWHVRIPRQCFANGTELGDSYYPVPWSDQPETISPRVLQFSTAPGAQLPDIEATVNSCTELNGDNSAAIRIANVTSTYYNTDPCPVVGATIRPEKCVFKSAAKELAANISTAVLQEMNCDEGDWRTIALRCPSKKNSALPQSAGFGVGWLLLALAFSISNVL